jgi:DegV family protein with EDD domain
LNKIKILTDSTCDLSKEMMEQFGIDSIPLYVRFDQEIYKDGIDITPEDLYEKVKEKKELPKTSAVSPGDFITFFEKYLNKGFDIIYIGIGSKLSATIRSAYLARDEIGLIERIHIIDSMNLSSGIGLLVLKAKDLRDLGLTSYAITEKIESLVPLVSSQFAIQTLDYLHKGGRASGIAKLVGTMLSIKPIIKVVNGSLEVYKKPIGKMSRALDIMLEDFFKDLENIDLDYVFITHTLANRQAIYMMDHIKRRTRVKHLIEGHAGCVISAHCGAGTIGILYIKKL